MNEFTLQMILCTINKALQNQKNSTKNNSITASLIDTIIKQNSWEMILDTAKKYEYHFALHVFQEIQKQQS